VTICTPLCGYLNQPGLTSGGINFKPCASQCNAIQSASPVACAGSKQLVECTTKAHTTTAATAVKRHALDVGGHMCVCDACVSAGRVMGGLSRNLQQSS
jgi:hypothetical protein